MTIDEMKQRKKELGYSNQTLAQKSGVPLGTLQKIFSGATQSPREDTIAALEQALKPWPNYSEIPGNHMFLHDSAVSCYGNDTVKRENRKSDYHRDCEYPDEKYTLTDYLALPEEQRMELIDGVFYDMASPTTVHQALAGYLHKILLEHVLSHNGPCFPFISPVDVQLDCDEKTVVQPDVMIICDREKYKKGRIFGAPDFIAEILSPSTKKKDMSVKMYKYFNAGVREYWLIDPDKKRIVQYDIEHLEIPTLYSFEDSVPVLIWNGECQVDFKEMYKNISFLWE